MTANKEPLVHPMLNKYCIIRTYSAGVHIGIVQWTKGMEMLLINARRLWRWYGAFTLSEVATKGIGEDSRISCEVSQIYLTEVIEIIPISDEAAKTYKKYYE